MSKALKWQQIDDYHQRAMVPGGWLVKAFESVCHNLVEQGMGMEDGWDFRVGMCFVPDQHHEWKLPEEV